MKILSLLISLLFLSNIIYAQTNIDSSKEYPEDSIKEFKTVQVEAQFPGGMEGWSNYLQKNLNANLGARYIKVKKGESVIQTAIVSFLVDKQGNIAEVTILNPDEIHPKLAKEAIRVIAEGPKWIPATQNGKLVIYRQKQKISWQVTGE